MNSSPERRIQVFHSPHIGSTGLLPLQTPGPVGIVPVNGVSERSFLP